MSERDPKLNPKPGDLLAGPMLKARVERITLGKEDVIEGVEYIVGHVDHPFQRQKGCNVSLQQWQRFVASPAIKVLVQA